MTVTTHERWCIEHVTPVDGSPDFCVASAERHGVMTSLSRDCDHGPVLCEVHTNSEAYLSPPELRQVAAMLLNMADALEKTRAAGQR